jgi:hypothetical protein
MQSAFMSLPEFIAEEPELSTARAEGTVKLLALLGERQLLQACTSGLLKKPGSATASGIDLLHAACRSAGSGWMGGSDPGIALFHPAFCPKQRKESGGEPLQVDRGGDEEGLNAHVVETAADDAGETVQGLRLAVKRQRCRWERRLSSSDQRSRHLPPEYERPFCKRSPSSGQIGAGTSYPPTVIAFQKLRIDLRTSQQEMLLVS